MSFKEKVKELQKKLDLNTYHPGYIHKPIFRCGFVVMVIFIVLLMSMFGISASWFSVDCEGKHDCLNPFIDCQDNYFTEPLRCNYYNNHDCVGINCNEKYISPGDYIGQKPPSIVENGNLYLLLILIITLSLNHIRWGLMRK